MYNSHIKDIHCNFKKSKENLLESQFYYEGCTAELKNFIANCPVYEATRNLKIVNVPEKPIIDEEGPHDEYQMDLWYLPKEIRNKIPLKYVMDIIDHFQNGCGLIL